MIHQELKPAPRPEIKRNRTLVKGIVSSEGLKYFKNPHFPAYVYFTFHYFPKNKDEKTNQAQQIQYKSTKVSWDIKNKKEYEKWKKKLEPYSHISLYLSYDAKSNAYFSKNSTPSLLDIQLEKGEELSTLLNLVKSNDKVLVELFGQLTLNREMNSYETQFHWKNKSVTLSLFIEEESINSQLQTAKKLWKNQNEWDKKIKQNLSTELYESYTGWVPGDEKPLSPEEFMNTIELFSINISENGDFEFLYDDKDLFWGHLIVISGNINGELYGSGIHG